MKKFKHLWTHFLILLAAAACVIAAAHSLLSFGAMMIVGKDEYGMIISFLLSIVMFFTGLPFAFLLGFATTLPVLLLIYWPIALKLSNIKARLIVYGLLGLICGAVCGVLAPDYSIKPERLERSIPIILFYALAGFLTALLHHYFLRRFEKESDEDANEDVKNLC